MQFGATASDGFVVAGLSHSEVAWVTSLRPAADVEVAIGAARQAGIDARRSHELLLLLAVDQGVRADHAWLGDDSAVVVMGESPLRSAVAQLISLELRGWCAVIHGTFGELPGGQLTVLVTAPGHDGGGTEAQRLLATGSLVLTLSIEGEHVLVGPLADGTSSSPCLQCLYAYRRDCDARWPHVASQTDLLSGTALSPATQAIVAGVVAQVCRAVLSGGGLRPGTGIAVNTRRPGLTAYRWARHPGCPHHVG